MASQTNLAARLAAVFASAVSSGGGGAASAGQAEGTPQEQPRPLQLDGHVRQLPLQAPQVRERAPADDRLGHVTACSSAAAHAHHLDLTLPLLSGGTSDPAMTPGAAATTAGMALTVRTAATG
jgi:hypothetical protein